MIGTTRTPPTVCSNCRLAVAAFLLLLLLPAPGLAGDPPPNPGPCVRNLQLEPEGDRIIATYDLNFDAPAAVRLIGSSDGGDSFGMTISAVSGDVGDAVPPGPGRRIAWELLLDYPDGLDDVDVYLDVVADPTTVPTYAVVRVSGILGPEQTAEAFLSQLDAAVALSPSVLVVEIQSPGGLYTELESILDRLEKLRQSPSPPRLVGLVRQQALHAAGFLAATLDKTYLLPRAEIGGTADADAWGSNKLVDDVRIYPMVKHKAAVAAEKAGRNPLLVKAYAGRKRDVYVCADDPPLFTEKPWKIDLECRLVVGAGGRLRLDAEDALAFGLAEGVVGGYEALGQALGYDRWVALRIPETAPPGRSAQTVSAGGMDRAQLDYEFLLADLRDAAGALRSGQPRQVTGATDLVIQVRRCAEEIQEIGSDYPDLADRVKEDFDRDLGSIIASCNAELQAIRAHRRRFKY